MSAATASTTASATASAAASTAKIIKKNLTTDAAIGDNLLYNETNQVFCFDLDDTVVDNNKIQYPGLDLAIPQLEENNMVLITTARGLGRSPDNPREQPQAAFRGLVGITVRETKDILEGLKINTDYILSPNYELQIEFDKEIMEIDGTKIHCWKPVGLPIIFTSPYKGVAFKVFKEELKIDPSHTIVTFDDNELVNENYKFVFNQLKVKARIYHVDNSNVKLKGSKPGKYIKFPART